MSQSKLVRTIKRFRDDPALFVRSWFGVEPDPRQQEIMAAVARGDRGIAVKSGHGVGKTTLLGWLAVWWITVYLDAKVRITAPTSTQLHDTLLPEMKSWIRRMPDGVQDKLYAVKAERVEFKPAADRNFISAATSRADQPDAMQGVHATHTLIVGDEASGIPDPVYEASVGSMSSPHSTMLLAGNPVRNKGFFFDCFTKPGVMENWTPFTISCVDHARITPDFIEEQRQRYGEDSNAFRIRVLGEFPRGDDDAVIPMHLIQAAIDRDVEIVGSVVWGVDVARFGSDATALAKRRGNGLLEPVRKWRGLDTMQVAAALKQEWDMTSPNMRPYDILIDVIGYGAGVVDRLREIGLPARGVNVSENPAMQNQYVNLRSELWYKIREWLERRDSTMPRDEDLIADLAMPSYRFVPPKNRIMVQPKASRLGGEYKGLATSPNCGDALAMTFANTAASMVHGTRLSRTEPVRRNIRGIV